MVAGRSAFGEMMMVHRVSEENVPVVAKVRMERKAKQAMVPPAAHFLADVNERRRQFVSVLYDPDPARALPNVHPPARRLLFGFKRKPDRFLPGTGHCLLDETRGQNGCSNCMRGRRDERRQ